MAASRRLCVGPKTGRELSQLDQLAAMQHLAVGTRLANIPLWQRSGSA